MANVFGAKKGTGQLNKSRLITFGCSFTYGEGLPNCRIGNNYDEYSNAPSDLAWPNKLGQLMNIDVINNGKPGASNLEILYHILNFKFHQNDLAVIMWTFPNRDVYFVSTSKKIKPFRQLGLWLKPKSKYIAEWLCNFQPVDQSVKSWIYIHHATLYLKSIGIDYLHYPINPNELNLHKPNFVPEPDNFYSDGFISVDQCDNDPHPGIKSHIITANKIFNIIKTISNE